MKLDRSRSIRRVSKAVFPAAGLGTRFLPAAKAMPKEMVTLIDKPLIQYAVEEAAAASIEHFVFVVGRNKGAIGDHFDAVPELQSVLHARGRETALAELHRQLPAAGAASFTRQQEPLGLGHAIWCARHMIGNDPFAVLLPDVVMRAKPGGLAQIMETYSVTGGNVIGIEECSSEETSKYGVVALGEDISDAAVRITNLVEKPLPGRAPSRYFMNGRYILQPEIFEHLAACGPGTGGEIQLTDGILRLAREQPIIGHRFTGRSFDCGSPDGLLAAIVALALDDPPLNQIVLREVERYSGEGTS